MKTHFTCREVNFGRIPRLQSHFFNIHSGILGYLNPPNFPTFSISFSSFHNTRLLSLTNSYMSLIPIPSILPASTNDPFKQSVYMFFLYMSSLLLCTSWETHHCSLLSAAFLCIYIHICIHSTKHPRGASTLPTKSFPQIHLLHRTFSHALCDTEDPQYTHQRYEPSLQTLFHLLASDNRTENLFNSRSLFVMCTYGINDGRTYPLLSTARTTLNNVKADKVAPRVYGLLANSGLHRGRTSSQ